MSGVEILQKRSNRGYIVIYNNPFLSGVSTRSSISEHFHGVEKIKLLRLLVQPINKSKSVNVKHHSKI